MRTILIAVCLLILSTSAFGQKHWSGHAKDEAPPPVHVKKPPKTKKLKKGQMPVAPINTAHETKP